MYTPESAGFLFPSAEEPNRPTMTSAEPKSDPTLNVSMNTFAPNEPTIKKPVQTPPNLTFELPSDAPEFYGKGNSNRRKPKDHGRNGGGGSGNGDPGGDPNYIGPPEDPGGGPPGDDDSNSSHYRPPRWDPYHPYPGRGGLYPTHPWEPPIRLKVDYDKLSKLTAVDKFYFWDRKFRVEAKTYGFDLITRETLVTSEVPRIQADIDRVNAIGFLALDKCVTMVEGRHILHMYINSANGHAAYHEIRTYCQRSPAAHLATQNLRERLVILRFDKAKWKGSLNAFVDHVALSIQRLDEMATAQGEGTMSDTERRQKLETALSNVTEIAEIRARETHFAHVLGVRGGRMGYYQFLRLVKQVAQEHDRQQASRKAAQARGTANKAQISSVDSDDDDESTSDSESESDSYDGNSRKVNEANGKYSKDNSNLSSARRLMMKKEFWTELSPKTQALLDGLPDDQIKILYGYRSDKKDRLGYKTTGSTTKAPSDDDESEESEDDAQDDNDCSMPK